MIDFPSLTSIVLGIGFGVTIALLAYKARALSRGGAIAAAVLGTIIFGLGGIPATLVLLTFFISSSGLSFLFKRKKMAHDEKHAKGSRRDAGQVLANGGVGGVMIILAAIFPGADWLWWAFCASLAAANADTWATELGVLSPSQPRLITSGQPVEMGTSGGITPVGTYAALAGAFVVALVGVITHGGTWVFLLTVTLAGLLGAMVDSLLGATIQAVYYCPACRKETERHPAHTCGTATVQKRGFRWLDNDWVNAFCTFTPVIVLWIFQLFK